MSMSIANGRIVQRDQLEIARQEIAHLVCDGAVIPTVSGVRVFGEQLIGDLRSGVLSNSCSVSTVMQQLQWQTDEAIGEPE